MVEILENTESQFAINQQVAITNGLYRDNYGLIKNYEKKTDRYHIEVTIENSKKIIAVQLKDLRTVKSWKFW